MKSCPLQRVLWSLKRDANIADALQLYSVCRESRIQRLQGKGYAEYTTECLIAYTYMQDCCTCRKEPSVKRV